MRPIRAAAGICIRCHSKKPLQAEFSACSPPAEFINQALPNGRGRSSGVEHYLAKVRVVSSNLIARSRIYQYRCPTGPITVVRSRAAGHLGRTGKGRHSSRRRGPVHEDGSSASALSARLTTSPFAEKRRPCAEDGAWGAAPRGACLRAAHRPSLCSRPGHAGQDLRERRAYHRDRDAGSRPFQQTEQGRRQGFPCARCSAGSGQCQPAAARRSGG